MSSAINPRHTSPNVISAASSSQDQITQELINSLFVLNEANLNKTISRLFLYREDRLILLGDLLFTISENFCHDVDEKMVLICAISRLDPFKPVMEKMLSLYPSRFATVMRYINSREIKLELFNFIIQRKGDFAFTWLAKAAFIIVNKESATEFNQLFLEDFLAGFSPMNLMAFENFCLSRCCFSDCASLISLLNDEDLVKDFLVMFYTTYQTSSDLSKKCEILIKMIDDKRKDESCPAVVQCLIQHDKFPAGAKEAILTNFLNHFYWIQVWILKICKEAELKKVFELQPSPPQNAIDLHAKWLEGMLEMDDYFESRVETMGTFINCYDMEKLPELITALAKIHDSHQPPASLALPYLALQLCIDNVEDGEKLDSQERKLLFQRAVPKRLEELKFICSLISKEQRQHIFRNLLVFLDRKDEEPDDWPFYNISSSIERVYGEVKETESHEIMIRADLVHVPPFYLALAVDFEQFRKWLVRAAIYMTDEQLKSMMQMIPRECFLEFIGQMFPILSHDQFILALDCLPKEHLVLYFQSKTDLMHDLLAELHIQLKELNAKLTALEQLKDSKIEYAKAYEEFEQKLFEFQGIITNCSNHRHRIIRTRILEIAKEPRYVKDAALKETFFRFPPLMDSCQAFNQLLSGPEGLFSLLAKLPSIEDSNDSMLSKIHNRYWELITLISLPELGLRDSGIILERGLRSDHDFQCLGLCYTKQEKVASVRKILERFMGLVLEAHFEKYKLENKDNKKEAAVYVAKTRADLSLLLKLSVPFSLELFRQRLDKFLDIYVETEVTPESVVEFIKIMRIIHQIEAKSVEEEQHVSILLRKLESEKGNPVQLKILCREIFDFALIFFKRNDFLENLKRYLQQEDLDYICTAMHSNEIFSLSEFLQLESDVQLPQDCYHLKKFFKYDPSKSEN